jgi:ribosomal protein L7/L12
LKDELIKLVEANKKVKAIKKLRDVTGMGLKEAKDYVDRLIKNR